MKKSKNGFEIEPWSVQKPKEAIVTLPRYIAPDTRHLSEETRNNHWSISFKKEYCCEEVLRELSDFLWRVIRNREEQLAISKSTSALPFYLWHDFQSGTLEFNVIVESHGKLPFGTNEILEKPFEYILRKYFEESNHGFIALSELTEVEKSTEPMTWEDLEPGTVEVFCKRQLPTASNT